MGQAIGDLLPAAIGVALSPVPIIAIVLILGTPRAKGNGLTFALGWIAGLTVVSVIVLLLFRGADDSSSGTSTAVGWIKLVLGALFLLMAVQQWRARPRPGTEAATPKWMAAIDSVTPAKARGLGVLLSGANPKNLALTFAAAASIAQSGLSGIGDAEAVALFVVLGSVTVVGPVVLYLVAPQQAATWLGSIKDFMAAHNAVIMMVVLLVLGAKLLGNGIQILTD